MGFLFNPELINIQSLFKLLSFEVNGKRKKIKGIVERSGGEERRRGFEVMGK